MHSPRVRAGRSHACIRPNTTHHTYPAGALPHCGRGRGEHDRLLCRILWGGRGIGVMRRLRHSRCGPLRGLPAMAAAVRAWVQPWLLHGESDRAILVLHTPEYSYILDLINIFIIMVPSLPTGSQKESHARARLNWAPRVFKLILNIESWSNVTAGVCLWFV